MSHAAFLAADAIRSQNQDAILRGIKNFGRTRAGIGHQQHRLRDDFLRQGGLNEADLLRQGGLNEAGFLRQGGLNEADLLRQGGLNEAGFLRQRRLNEAGFQPFIDAGEQGLGFLREGSTAGGFNRSLSDIMGGDVFQALRDEQVKDARGQLAASGQTGSGLALEEISKISPQLALQLEGELFGRNQNLADLGFQGTQVLGQLGGQLTTNRAQIGNQLALGRGKLGNQLAISRGQIGNQLALGRGELGNQLTLGQGELTTGLEDLEARLGESLSAREQTLISGTGLAQAEGFIGFAADAEKRRAENQARRSGIGRLVGSAIGGAGGFLLGGPAGARLGGSLGGQIGGFF